MAHELAAGLDDRARALGERLAASPEPWLAKPLGILAPHASPLLREDYARRAAAAAAYREAAGITDPGQAIAPEPHRGNPELDDLRRTAIRALEIRDETEIVRGMTQGELEARILDGDRALASAPPDVSRELRLTAQAEADAWQQSADAEIRYDQAGSANAKALARHMAAQREQLEAANASYETWAADTSGRRETAGKARTELERRGLAQQTAGTAPSRGRKRTADHGGVVAPARSRPRRRRPGHRARAPGRARRRQALATRAHAPTRARGRAEPDSSARSYPEADSQSGPDDQAALLDRLLGRAAEAAQRFAAENADRKARAKYATRLEREAYAQPEHAVKPKPHMRQISSCKSRRAGVAGYNSMGFPGSDLASSPSR